MPACFFENSYEFKRLFRKPHQISVPALLLSNFQTNLESQAAI
jgi:hypothetical protein